jgi:hypothetical protein
VSDNIRGREIGWAIVYLLLTALVIGVIGVVVQTFSLLSTVRETQKVSKSSVETIRDCTEPEGQCYQESQKRTAKVVADIGKVSAYAAACADRPGTQTEDDVLACVLRRLAKDEQRP